jgi:hypothetical protein
LSEGPRRLPLISVSSLPSSPRDVAQVRAPARAIVIADTGDGSSALSMAQVLSQSCVLAGKAPFVVLSAFGSEPALSLAFEGSIRVARLGVLEVGDVAAFARDHADVTAPWICVGVPTLRGLVGALRILVAGPKSTPTEQSAAAGSERVDLVLRGARPGLARPLIEGWLAAAQT